jgi:hypothetical protein
VNNLVGLLSYMIAGKKVDQVNNMNLALQYIVIHTSCTFADASQNRTVRNMQGSLLGDEISRNRIRTLQ